ncbi:hypothetical protein F2Q69_00043905 [Brassica cretica]|uniref:Uncharacterized protein n=1 Tax=Brassica cretica TaxID=69181 RepID=A0A8S9NEU3_BRACR|nr:hypothetical protein F2Q69_00043905 [Brassica cretica]
MNLGRSSADLTLSDLWDDFSDQEESRRLGFEDGVSSCEGRKKDEGVRGKNHLLRFRLGTEIQTDLRSMALPSNSYSRFQSAAWPSPGETQRQEMEKTQRREMEKTKDFYVFSLSDTIITRVLEGTVLLPPN